MYKELKIASRIQNYSIFFISNLQELEKFILAPETLIVLDENIANLYPTLSYFKSCVVKCTENNKTIDGSTKVLEFLIEQKANINTRIVVVGGGILQDIVGFCCSIYCRGISYTLVPTTLLSQTDSCIGGKTSINFKNKKNILGTFYPPKNIYIVPSFLDTLSVLDITSGLGEIYKFLILQNKIENLQKLENYNDIPDLIYDSLKYKKTILEIDEFDKAERKFLNFGHTFGHALESTSNYAVPHGVAVIIGCMIALNISRMFGYHVPNINEWIEKGTQLVKKTNLVLNKQWFLFSTLLEATKADKKSTGKLTMVLFNNSPVVENVDNMAIVQKAIQQVYESF